MSASNRLIVSILAIAALAIAFWMLTLGPKREEASELAGQVEQARLTLTEAQAKATEAAAARREFPDDYRQLVVLGQSVPAGDETSSLLVEVNHIADRAKVRFNSLLLSSSGEGAVAPPATMTPEAGASSGSAPASATVPPTEAAAAVMPLGASVGPAGLAVMPYSLSFSGNFFQVANFVEGIDSLVDTGDNAVAVDGRLVTLNGFALNPSGEGGGQELNASFAVTTYLVPPSQGLTAGATPTAPAPSVTTPAGAGAAAGESTTASSSAEAPASEPTSAEAPR